MMIKTPRISGIYEALTALQKIVPPTPLKELEWQGKTLWCKCESHQPIGAFKLRGAWHRLSGLSDAEKVRGVVAFSSGNHAQGVAWAARELGISAAIVMPGDTPAIKLEGTRKLGAEVILYDRMTESREEIAAALAASRGAVLVPSFDDPWVVEGQGSTGLEAVQQLAELGLPAPSLIITPCGGGGLAAGLALAVPAAQMVVVEPEGWDDMGASLRAGHIVPVAPNPPPTRCDALQTLRVADLTFGILQERSAVGVSVSEQEVLAAMRVAHEALDERLEPGGAVALAAVLAGRVVAPDGGLVILSGGNVDQTLYAEMLLTPAICESP